MFYTPSSRALGDDFLVFTSGRRCEDSASVAALYIQCVAAPFVLWGDSVTFYLDIFLQYPALSCGEVGDEGGLLYLAVGALDKKEWVGGMIASWIG